MTQSTAVAAPQEGRVPAAPKEPVSTGGPISALVPQNIEQAFRLAQALSQSGDMVPKAFQGEPQKIMAAIVKGMEVGLAPMQALASIAVINGRAALWGDALPALVQRAGHHIDVEVEGEGDRAVAVARLTRGDTGKVVERRFSMADAKRAGLTGKQGPWTQYPTRMLMMRARAFAVRDGAADALMGLQLSEEVSDYGPDRARDVTPSSTAPRRKGVRYVAPEADPEPKIDAIVEHEVEPEDTLTPEQLAAAEREALADIQRRDREELA